MKLDPKALATCYEDTILSSERKPVRPGVQVDVDEDMIYDYVVGIEALPPVSARPFAAYIDENWFNYNEEPGDLTNEKLIEGALAYWRGQ